MGRTEGKLGHYPSPGGGTALAGYNRGCCAQGTGERQTSCLDHKQLMGLRGSCQDRLWRKKNARIARILRSLYFARRKIHDLVDTQKQQTQAVIDGDADFARLCS